jgi:hypothetical protein
VPSTDSPHRTRAAPASAPLHQTQSPRILRRHPCSNIRLHLPLKMKLQRLIDSTTVVADQEKAKPHQQSLEPFILSSESPCRRSFFGCHHAICFCVAVAFFVIQ